MNKTNPPPNEEKVKENGEAQITKSTKKGEKKTTTTHSQQTPPPSISSGRRNIGDIETFQKINYLFQAAHVVTASSPRASSVPAYLCSLIHGTSQKAQIRMEPQLKRSMCKGCQGLLIPGITATVRIKSRPSGVVIWTCLLCKTLRRFPTKRGYKLWVEKAEADVQF